MINRRTFYTSSLIAGLGATPLFAWLRKPTDPEAMVAGLAAAPLKPVPEVLLEPNELIVTAASYVIGKMEKQLQDAFDTFKTRRNCPDGFEYTDHLYERVALPYPAPLDVWHKGLDRCAAALSKNMEPILRPARDWRCIAQQTIPDGFGEVQVNAHSLHLTIRGTIAYDVNSLSLIYAFDVLYGVA